MKKYIFIFFLFAGFCVIAQQNLDIKMKPQKSLFTAKDFYKILESKKIRQYLQYQIHKKASETFESEGYIYKEGDAWFSTIFYTLDTLYFHNSYNTFKITNSDLESDLENFITGYKNIPESDCTHAYVLAKKMHLPPESFTNNIGISRNEIEIFLVELNTNNRYEYNYRFIHKIGNYKCMSFFKNLKSRKKFKAFKKLIQLIPSNSEQTNIFED